MHRWALGGLAAVVVMAAPLAAEAQAAPDVVMTRDGGMMRGTIVESVPGDHVTIALGNGQTRTVPWAQVEYAGPESDRPSGGLNRPVPTPPPQGYAPPGEQTVTLRVQGQQDNIALHRVTGTATATAWTGSGMAAIRAYSFERLCGVPCELQVPPGSHQFALSQGNGGEVPAEALDIRGDGTLYTHYVDRTGIRVAGWLTLIIGGLAGAAWMVIPLATTDFGLSGDDSWLVGLIGGSSVLIVAEVVGLILALQGDGSELRFDAL